MKDIKHKSFEIKTVEINDQKEWTNLVKQFPDHTFLQAWSWAEFKQKLGLKVLRLAFYKDNTLIAVTQCIFEQDRYGKWMYCPYGPLANWNHRDFSSCLKKLIVIAKENNCIYLTLDPQIEDTSESNAQIELIKSIGFIEAERHIQAQHKWLLNLGSSEEELLLNMRKNTRYSIKKAYKEGVVVKNSQNISDFNNFLSVLKQTSGRKKFFIFEESYYKNQFEILSKNDNIVLFWAEYLEKPVSSALIAYFGDHAAYLWGATSNDLPNSIPAAYPVLWEAIREAKKRGVKIFDFWGVLPPTIQKHEWSGFSFFKTGFGGYYKKLILPYDFPLSLKYWVNRFIVKTRKIWAKIYRIFKTAR